MDSSNVSELNIIQESSDAAARLGQAHVLRTRVFFFHLVRLGTREGRDPRLGAPRVETRDPRGSRPENEPENGMQARLLSIQGFRSEMDLETSPTRTTKS